MDGEGRDGRLRSFVLGGLLGASAVLAAARRRRPKRRQRRRPSGVAGFGDAPCYREAEQRRPERTSTPRCYPWFTAALPVPVPKLPCLRAILPPHQPTDRSP